MPDQSISSELMVGSDLIMELKILPFNVLGINRSTLCPDQKNHDGNANYSYRDGPQPNIYFTPF